MTRDGSDHADPLPIVVQEALAGCPPWWEQALRESWRCNAERITSPASYLLKTLRRWKADPAAAPPDPALPPQRAPTNATDARVARARAYIAPRLAPMEAAAAALERQGATPPAPRLRILEEADA